VDLVRLGEVGLCFVMLASGRLGCVRKVWVECGEV
jgi:hypothetical protein